MQTARGIVAALVATFVALFSHSIADGTAPSRVGILLAVAFAVPTCIVLAGKRMSRIRLTVSVLSSQFAFHAAMLLGNPETSTSAASGPTHHQRAPVPVLDLTSTVDHSSHDSSMWAAHLLAALVTILALRQGERAFWSIVGRRRFESVWAILAVTVRPVDDIGMPAPAPFSSRTRPRLVTLSPLRHRGPPVVAA